MLFPESLCASPGVEKVQQIFLFLLGVFNRERMHSLFWNRDGFMIHTIIILMDTNRDMLEAAISYGPCNPQARVGKAKGALLFPAFPSVCVTH